MNDSEITREEVLAEMYRTANQKKAMWRTLACHMFVFIQDMAHGPIGDFDRDEYIKSITKQATQLAYTFHDIRREEESL